LEPCEINGSLDGGIAGGLSVFPAWLIISVVLVSGVVFLCGLGVMVYAARRCRGRGAATHATYQTVQLEREEELEMIEQGGGGEGGGGPKGMEGGGGSVAPPSAPYRDRPETGGNGSMGGKEVVREEDSAEVHI
jgi:hypothetical protein